MCRRIVDIITVGVVFSHLSFSGENPYSRDPADNCSLYVYPDTVKNLAIGDTFQVEIRVANINMLHTYQVGLRWNGTDSSNLKLINIERGPFLSQGGISTKFFSWSFQDSPFPSLMCMEAILGEHYQTGSGILAYITFEVKDTVATALNLFTNKMISLSGSHISHHRRDGYLHYTVPSQNLPDTVWVRRYSQWDGSICSDKAVDLFLTPFCLYVLTCGAYSYPTGWPVYQPGETFWQNGDASMIIKYSLDGDTIWKRTDGSAPAGFVVDKEGNCYFLGTRWTSSSQTYYDYKLIKYSQQGSVLWTQYYDYNRDFSSAIAVDNNGNIIVTGYSGLVYGEYDWATIKYSSQGNVIWTRRYPLGGTASPAGIVVASNDDIYITGKARRVTNNYDFLTIKYSSSGDTLWVKWFNGVGNGDDYPCAICKDSYNNVYITGASYNATGGYDFLTIKYSPSGELLWVQYYNSIGNGNDIPTAIKCDAFGNIYIGGTSSWSNDNADYLVLKYSSDGELLWHKEYNGPIKSYDFVTDIAIDEAGDVFLTGGSYGNRTGCDFATLKYSSAGELLWESRYNNSYYADGASAVVVDDAGNIYVTGTSYSDAFTGMDIVTIKYHPGVSIEEVRSDFSTVGDNLLFVKGNIISGKEITIRYSMSKRGRIQLSLYDVAGRNIKSLFDGVSDSGRHEINTKIDLTSGVYFIRLTTESGAISKKFVFI
ncbi:MAG: T9SS type A sorting domain-containing protein [bacterium]|nr:T9SS type A sorting domain-containing protein [bacterium]